MKRALMLSLLIPVLVLAACNRGPSGETPPPSVPPKGEITIGSKSLTEQYLLMKMSALLLKERGFHVNEMVFLDSPAIRSASEAGVVDLYWEYTSTARLFYHKEEPIFDPDEAFERVAETDREKGIVWLPRSDFNSSWALLIRKDMADRLNIRTVSELAEYVRTQHPNLRFATNDEYLEREDGPERLQQLYGFHMDQLITVESDLLTQAVRDGRVDVAVGIASDPRIQAYQLVVLEDDRQAFPPYHAAPVVYEKTLGKFPEIREVMEKLTPHITNESMLEAMYQVDILQKDVTNVARNFLVERNLYNP
ncbi:MAG TPA: glycine betaine ABC transporter substrate-binding protein [Paenibacillaceae bacterium]